MDSNLPSGKAMCFKVSNFMLWLSLVFLISFNTSENTHGQTPQGFTYQALAMNSLGQPLRDQALPVRITIQSDSLGGTVFWQELHSTVTTNGSGFFSLILGKGSRLDGTVATFADIDWSVTPKFIMTEIDYGRVETNGLFPTLERALCHDSRRPCGFPEKA
jgi:hypothetical protein